MAKFMITDTVLRDGHQSQAATRMTTAEMLPACEMLDKVGYYSLECWGGATYDSCLRFLNEDPWERLRKLRKALPNTKLQMLLRGQNLLGYRPYADDVVEAFVQKAIENGIDIIRCFDALNDLRNMRTAVKARRPTLPTSCSCTRWAPTSLALSALPLRPACCCPCSANERRITSWPSL